MARFLKDRYLWYVVALLVLSGVFVYSAEGFFLDRIPSELERRSAYMLLMTLRSSFLLLAVVLAAWRFGVRGGLTTCLIIGLFLAPHIIDELAEHFVSDTLAHYGIWGAVGIIFSWLVGTRKRVVEILQEGENKYRFLVDNALVGVYKTNLKGDVLYVNDALVGMFGFDSAKEMMAGGAVIRYKNSEDRTAFIEELTKKGKVSSYELKTLTKTGELKEVLLSGILKDHFISGMIIDITERKQTEQETSLLLEMTQAISESQSFHAALEITLRKVCGATGWDFGEAWVPSRDEKVLECSPVWYSSSHGLEEFRQLSKEFTFPPNTGLPGRVWSSKQSEWIPDIPSQPETVFYRTQAVLGAGFKTSLGIPVIANGRVLAVLVFFMVKSREEDKRLIEVVSGVAGQLSSVIQRKQVEEKLAQAAEEWETTFNAVTDLVSVIDKDFKIVRANKAYADFFKMKLKELIGKHCYEVFHGTKEHSLTCPHVKTLETGEPFTVEFYEPHLGAYFEVTTSPIFNEKGEVMVSVNFAKDITERKRMEENLIMTDRLASVGELAAGVAHELNNPLTGVIGFSELLLEKDVPLDIREDIAIIHREAKRTAEIVKNLLTFSGKHPLSKQPLDINSIIAGVLGLRAYEQKVNNIKVITHFARNLPQVIADPFQLQQVFLNIVINAEYFMSEAHSKGTLAITTERVRDVVRASFADNGHGISKEKLGHVFDPFFTTKGVGKGTGLGLSICHGMVTEHGGKIYAQSELGKGATFVVELPIATTDEKGGSS